MITYGNELKEKAPDEIMEFLEDHFTYEVPIGIDSEIAMRKAGNMLATLTNAYSYLASLLAALSVYTKTLKNKCPNKPKKATDEELYDYEIKRRDYEEMALKKALVEQKLDVVKQQYNCISRMITVKIEADKELKMSESRG